MAIRNELPRWPCGATEPGSLTGAGEGDDECEGEGRALRCRHAISVWAASSGCAAFEHLHISGIVHSAHA